MGKARRRTRRGEEKEINEDKQKKGVIQDDRPREES